MSIKDPEFAARVIADLGGTAQAARFCDVTAGAVSQWRHTGIPKSQLRFIRAARPEIFLVHGAPPASDGKHQG